MDIAQLPHLPEKTSESSETSDSESDSKDTSGITGITSPCSIATAYLSKCKGKGGDQILYQDLYMVITVSPIRYTHINVYIYIVYTYVCIYTYINIQRGRLSN
jgi:hypothetical protein